MKSGFAVTTIAVAALTSTACAGVAEEENVAATQAAEEGENGLDWNGLTSNGLTSNGLTSNGLTSNGLTSNGLTSNGLVMSALTDPLAQRLLTYVVSCALRPDQQISVNINGTPTTFYGSLGLAPEWGVTGGSCDADCRAWVSGCVLSRVNYLGQRVAVSLRGSDPILASSSVERAGYPNREASYYGDIFSSPQVRYACTSPGSTLISRVCGPSISDCIMNVVGDCDRFCDAADPTEGSYSNCRDPQGRIYPGSVTIFRQ